MRRVCGRGGPRRGVGPITLTALSYLLQHCSGNNFKVCRKPSYFLLRLKGFILNKKLFFTACCAQILLVRLKQFRDLGTWAVLTNKNGTSLFITNTKLCLGRNGLFPTNTLQNSIVLSSTNSGSVPGCLRWRT